MKIFIDFDGVIFNTELFKQQLIKCFFEAGVLKKDFEKSHQYFENQKIPYSAIKHLKFLKKFLKRKYSYKNDRSYSCILKLVEKLFKNLRIYVFKDVEKFLKSFSKNDLYLLSYGDLNFQKQKIKGAGIFSYFKRIIVTNKSKAKIIKEIIKKDKLSKSEKIIFIDDKLQFIEEVGLVKNITTIQLIRPQYKSISKFSKKADFRAENLTEIKKIIGNNVVI
ncbi:MAG: hypothetical protein DDT19_02632 [Syntrophomonadaceae bacterium]|nr:hypothetical protein [Bacillota bacterium]